MSNEWYDIPGFLNYSITKSGQVINKKTGRILSKDINNGYERVRLWREGHEINKKVHRLLAETFLPNPLGLSQVNHMDGNKRNNSLDNLEWCTAAHNMRHALANGLIVHGPNPNAGRTHRPVRVIETGKEYDSMSACARDINGDPNKIQDCLSGRQKTHRGYHFVDV